MSDKPISQYQVPEGIVLIAANGFDFFYDRVNGNEAIGMTCHDERLGPLAVLFAPEVATKVGHHLIEMSTDELERIRANYDELQKDQQ